MQADFVHLEAKLSIAGRARSHRPAVHVELAGLRPSGRDLARCNTPPPLLGASPITVKITAVKILGRLPYTCTPGLSVQMKRLTGT